MPLDLPDIVIPFATGACRTATPTGFVDCSGDSPFMGSTIRFHDAAGVELEGVIVGVSYDPVTGLESVQMSMRERRPAEHIDLTFSVG